jgi:hypothetical protein
MAVLSNRKVRGGPSSGHDFDRIEEKLYGNGRGKLNKRKELFNSDYIYIYRDDEDDDIIVDSEVGINKNRQRIHDMDWCNGEKDEHHAINRLFDDDDDITYGDVDVTTEDLEDFFFGEDGDDE